MSNVKHLMSIGELKSMLEIYGNEYYVDFGDRFLTKVDDHDTNVVSFQWIEGLDYEAEIKRCEEAMNHQLNRKP